MVLERHRDIRLSDYRAALARTGDVAVGVRARRRRIWNLVLTGIGIALIVAAGYLYFLLRPTEGGAGNRVAVRAKVRCVNPKCGYTDVLSVSSRFPLVCPTCKQRSLEELWWCQSCKREFMPAPEQVGGTVRCPECGSFSVGSAIGRIAPNGP